MSQPSQPQQSFSRQAQIADNRSHWDRMAPRWKAWWTRYGPASQPVSDKLVELAQPGPGARVLDLATGMGEPALSFARSLPDADVLGVDQSEAMIAYAREMAAEQGLGNARFLVADVEALDLPDEAAFDVLAARWGLMFVTDLPATLSRLHALLKPDGRLVAAVWAESAQVPMLSLASDVMKQTLGRDLNRPGPGPFTLADQDAFDRELLAAGFVLEARAAVDVVLSYTSAQDYLQDRAAMSPLLEDALAELSSEERTRFDAALEVAVAPWRAGQQVVLRSRSWCVSCRAK